MLKVWLLILTGVHGGNPTSATIVPHEFATEQECTAAYHGIIKLTPSNGYSPVANPYGYCIPISKQPKSSDSPHKITPN